MEGRPQGEKEVKKSEVACPYLKEKDGEGRPPPRAMEWLRLLTPLGIFLLTFLVSQQNRQLDSMSSEIKAVGSKVDQHIQYHLEKRVATFKSKEG